jgi:hypothetical protein
MRITGLLEAHWVSHRGATCRLFTNHQASGRADVATLGTVPRPAGRQASRDDSHLNNPPRFSNQASLRSVLESSTGSGSGRVVAGRGDARPSIRSLQVPSVRVARSCRVRGHPFVTPTVSWGHMERSGRGQGWAQSHRATRAKRAGSCLIASSQVPDRDPTLTSPRPVGRGI